MWPPCFVLPHCNTFTDVEDVKFVINYDYPNSSEDYIHRIGRTARSQKTGTAYTFFTPNNMKQASDLISVLREANQAINPKLIQMAEDRGGKIDNLFTSKAYTQKYRQQNSFNKKIKLKRPHAQSGKQQCWYQDDDTMYCCVLMQIIKI